MSLLLLVKVLWLWVLAGGGVVWRIVVITRWWNNDNTPNNATTRSNTHSHNTFTSSNNDINAHMRQSRPSQTIAATMPANSLSYHFHHRRMIQQIIQVLAAEARPENDSACGAFIFRIRF
jgi:hypothetical protein